MAAPITINTYTRRGKIYDEARAMAFLAEFEAFDAAIAAATSLRQKGLLKDWKNQAWERFYNKAPLITSVDGVPIFITTEAAVLLTDIKLEAGGPGAHDPALETNTIELPIEWADLRIRLFRNKMLFEDFSYTGNTITLTGLGDTWQEYDKITVCNY